MQTKKIIFLFLVLGLVVGLYFKIYYKKTIVLDHMLDEYELALINCEAGFGDSCLLYSNYTKDLDQKEKLLIKGCDFNDAISCDAAASLYMDLGKIKEAKIFADKGCKLGNSISCARF